VRRPGGAEPLLNRGYPATMSRLPSPPSPSSRPRVVVVGGGFGGISATRALRDTPCQVILLDRQNHHLFQPLLYQVATAALSPADIAHPIRSIFRRQDNVQVVMGEVESVDLARRSVLVGEDEVPYDWLVLAPGVTHAYFGNDHWAERAPGLKTIDDALEIRRRVLLAFEEAELEDDPEAREAKLTFVIVGGGPTGVELAGALREIAARTIPRDFRRVDTSTARIVLMEGQDRLLPGMSTRASALALRHLERMGVEVRLGAFVTDMDDARVTLGEERFPAANVIWAAGVRGSPLARGLGVELDGQGRVKVEQDCSVPGYPEAFVIGDLASLADPESGKQVPGVAQGALQMGRFVGEVIRDSLARGEPAGVRRPFHYVDKGTLATIGRARAVADMGDLSFGGFFAWVLWSTVHILYLVGFRNRILVMVNWAWQWLIQARGARLITGNPRMRLTKPVDL
jgi:NADH:ubiquinone reductase (H+-translocating)